MQKVTSSETPLRPRRSFSVNPAVDVIQRNAYNSYLERLAFNNRNFLDRVGKRVKASSGRVKRRMPSLSIDLPMSVLRQKLSLEKERKVQALRAAANRNFLNDIGKRDRISAYLSGARFKA
ncbi:unnamed protein product [Diatraea saccharalis]|uniref:Corticotropin-releasing factor domain-containing protein n=1 Tax=Diatraea saccharalis TaxID=40085 RepID=A0A9N9N237_9NEOP|nr:unnamed protein product [Diatraea saccharalis]